MRGHFPIPQLRTTTLGVAVCLAPLAVRAQHAHHDTPAKPAGAPPAATGPSAGIGARFSFDGGATGATGANGAPRVLRAGTPARLHLELTDRATGRPARGVEVAAWLDRRPGSEGTGENACRDRVNGYIQARAYMEGSLKARPIVDLNGYHVLTLNESPEIAVIDPFLGFGRTKLYTTVPLRAPGGGWAASRDESRLYVTIPSRGELAVVDAERWKVARYVPVGGAPQGVQMQPASTRAWVLTDSVEGRGTERRGGVVVVDAEGTAPAARLALGTGPFRLAFSTDGGTAFVTSAMSGTLSVVDARRLVVRRTVALRRPVDVAFNARAKAAVVADEEGTLVIVGGDDFGRVGRVGVPRGVRSLRAAPSADEAHGHGHHGAGSSERGRWVFAVSPQEKAVHVLDVVAGRLLRTATFEHAPDDVNVTSAFAYVHFSDHPKVALLSLDDPGTGGFGTLDTFEAGRAAPGAAADRRGEVMIPAPDMPDALYVLNAAERMIYYYHYMEGMPVPSGGLTTYDYRPRAVMVLGKAMRETAAGRYEATVRIDEPGAYDLLVMVPSPRTITCLPFEVTGERGQLAGRPPRLRFVLADGEAPPAPGLRTVRFRVLDAATGTPRNGLPDVELVAATTDGWSRRARARPVDGGVYEVTLELPAAPAVLLSAAVPSLRVGFHHQPATVLRLAAAPPRPDAR